MQLAKKKELSARTLGVGKDRIVFNNQRLDDIKEAITKQDIRDLVKDNAIIIEEKTGRKTNVKRKTRKRAGSVKKTVQNKKRKYMTITRKLRSFIVELRKKEIINRDEAIKLRKEIRAHSFKSKAHFKERLTTMVKERDE